MLSTYEEIEFRAIRPGICYFQEMEAAANAMRKLQGMGFLEWFMNSLRFGQCRRTYSKDLVPILSIVHNKCTPQEEGYGN